MDWEYVIASVIETILGIVITVAIPYVVTILKKKVDNQVAYNLIVKASIAVNDCVKYVNQTYVNELKKEGKFDLEAQKEAFNKCLEAVNHILSDATKDAIVSVCGDLETWTRTQIESNVLTEKVEQ